MFYQKHFCKNYVQIMFKSIGGVAERYV